MAGVASPVDATGLSQGLRAAEVIGGCALACLTVLDVFETVVAPGSSQGWLRVASRVRVLSLPLWRRRAARRDGPPRIPPGLAPSILTATFTLWMGLLVVAFGLIDSGLRADFRPPLKGFADALYISGMTLVTTGLTGGDVTGAARWVVMVAGFAGLAVLTMSVTYILAVQTALQRRDAALVKLSTTAGRPPTGMALLESYASLGCRSELSPFFREWRDWAGATLHSHSAHPVLGYFRSISSEMDWPLALWAVLDAAALYCAFVDGVDTGPAMLLHRDGARLTAVLERLYNCEAAAPDPADESDVSQLCERLHAAGYPVRGGKAACERFLSLRRDYECRLAALTDHFGVAQVRLLARHDAQTGGG